MVNTEDFNRSFKKGFKKKFSHKKKMGLGIIDTTPVRNHNIRQKERKDAIIRKAFINKVMKGVLGQGSRGCYLQNRFKSPQPQADNLIMLPSFDGDRGRRKISKMGGLQMGGLQMVFSNGNSSQSSAKK